MAAEEEAPVTRQMIELASSMEEMQLTMQEADRAIARLEAKIAARRSRNPLEPIPFELFSEFCRDWTEKCKSVTETVRCELRKTNVDLRAERDRVKEKEQQTDNESLVLEQESLEIQRKDNESKLKDVTKASYELRKMGAVVKRDATWEKIKLAETIRRCRVVGEDCAEQERNLEMIKEKIKLTENTIAELEADNRALREKKMRYKAPDVLEIAQKIDELEQVEKQLVRVVQEKLKK